MGKDEYSVAFIIAHKYFRGYPSYLKYYIENIIKFYGDNALVLVVDNNSLYKEDIFNEIPDIDNIVYLDNNIDCKFELGAYQVGINYILENDLLDKYDFYVCTQDNFIIKNKYDFNILLDKDDTACPINSWKPDGACGGVVAQVLSSIDLYNNLDKMTFCWCSSFVVSKLKLEQLYGYLQKIVITVRHQSCASERYLARILWELNNYKNTDIDGGLDELKRDYYDCWTVDPYADAKSFFVKKVQQKTEKTVDQ
tara:strand:+ start:4944 stop:5702 length:759 start_codon:yes stop_codon:yes gene_type:complete